MKENKQKTDPISIGLKLSKNQLQNVINQILQILIAKAINMEF